MIEPTSLSATPEAADASTFEAFFLAQHERLFQALYLLTGDRFEADDLAQEALLRTYERWDRVSAMESPAGYVYRTALNLYRSRLRSLLVRMRRGFAAVSSEDPSEPVSASHDIRVAIMGLPRGQREAVILVGWLGLESAEAGRVLGIDASSVRGRLHRARATLQEELEHDHE